MSFLKTRKILIGCFFLVLFLNLLLFYQYFYYKKNRGSLFLKESEKGSNLGNETLFLLKNSFDNRVRFHRIEPGLLPFLEYQELYHFLYEEKEETLAEPRVHPSIVINGHGCYVFEGIPRLCLGIFDEFFLFRNRKFIRFNILDKEKNLKAASVLVLSSYKGRKINPLLLFYDVKENKVYKVVDENGKEIFLDDPKTETILKRGQPIMIGLEEDEFEVEGVKSRATTVFFFFGYKKRISELGYNTEFFYNIY